MKTVLDTIQSGSGYLEKHEVESARLNMQYLLAHVLSCKRLDLYMEFDRPLGEPELAPLRDLVKRRANGEPLQHLLGTTEFRDHEFLSDARALIPRPETEELVTQVKTRLDSLENPKILDVGTGTGAIGLSLALEMDSAEVTLVDISPEALALAEENAKKYSLSEPRVFFLQSDLFSNVEGTFDAITANLPYIPAADIAGLSREVQFDPVLALDGGPTGTEIIEKCITEARNHLNENGYLALEIGIHQSESVAAILKAAGYQNIEIIADFDEIERFLIATL